MTRSAKGQRLSHPFSGSNFLVGRSISLHPLCISTLPAPLSLLLPRVLAAFFLRGLHNEIYFPPRHPVPSSRAAARSWHRDSRPFGSPDAKYRPRRREPAGDATDPSEAINHNALSRHRVRPRHGRARYPADGREIVKNSTFFFFDKRIYTKFFNLRSTCERSGSKDITIYRSLPGRQARERKKINHFLFLKKIIFFFNCSICDLDPRFTSEEDRNVL